MPTATNDPTVIAVGSNLGYQLEGFTYDERSNTYVVLLSRPYQNLDRYVTGRVKTLQDREWSLGHYFSYRPAAVRNMVARAGVDVT